MPRPAGRNVARGPAARRDLDEDADYFEMSFTSRRGPVHAELAASFGALLRGRRR